MLRDVAEPEPVGRVGAELPLHEIVVRGSVRLPAAPFPAMRDPDETFGAHESGDAFAGDVNSQPEPQFGEHPWCPVGCSRVGVDAANRCRQLRIRDGAPRG